jgi:hypothetical protein
MPLRLPAAKVSINSWVMRDAIQLEYSRDRLLEITGRVASLDAKTGRSTSAFATRPDFLSQKEFEAYAADADRGDSHYRVKLRCEAKPGEAKPKS